MEGGEVIYKPHIPGAMLCERLFKAADDVLRKRIIEVVDRSLGRQHLQNIARDNLYTLIPSQATLCP